MSEITTIGLDLAKSVFQVHGVNDVDGVVTRKRPRRGQLLTFFAGLPPCPVGMEASATAHVLVARACGRWDTICASPVYRTCLCSAIDPADLRQALWQAGGKNDAVDACACCEAVLRRGHALRAGQERGATSGVDAAQSRGLPIRQQTIDASTPCAGICRSLA